MSISEYQKTTQHAQIRDYLETHGSITPLQAIYELGITKLSTRIGEMIRAGEYYGRETVTVPNRYGKLCRVTRYFVDDDSRNNHGV